MDVEAKGSRVQFPTKAFFALKGKGTQGRMKGLTIAQWINLHRSVLARQYSAL